MRRENPNGSLANYGGREQSEWLGVTPATDGSVTLYRATPQGDAIGPGDYVTNDRTYAEQHISANLGGKGKITTLPATLDDIYPADGPKEFWYVPSSVTRDSTAVQSPEPKPASIGKAGKGKKRGDLTQEKGQRGLPREYPTPLDRKVGRAYVPELDTGERYEPVQDKYSSDKEGRAAQAKGRAERAGVPYIRINSDDSQIVSTFVPRNDNERVSLSPNEIESVNKAYDSVVAHNERINQMGETFLPDAAAEREYFQTHDRNAYFDALESEEYSEDYIPYASKDGLFVPSSERAYNAKFIEELDAINPALATKLLSEAFAPVELQTPDSQKLIKHGGYDLLPVDIRGWDKARSTLTPPPSTPNSTKQGAADAAEVVPPGRSSEKTSVRAKSKPSKPRTQSADPIPAHSQALWKRWKAAKKRAGSDITLAGKLGDFYEFFGADAEAVSKALDIPLTKRNGIPMAGVPVHSFDKYALKLVEAGLNVATVNLGGKATAPSIELVDLNTKSNTGGATPPPGFDMIGRTWNSPFGLQRIDKRIKSKSGDMFSVLSPDGTERRYAVARIEKTIKRQEYQTTPEYAKDMELAKKQSDQLHQKKLDKEAQLGEIQTFASSVGMTPMQAGRALKTLMVKLRFNQESTPRTRKDYIESRIAAGDKVLRGGKTGEQPRLEQANGEYMGQKQLTKVGLQYAEYLLAAGDNKATPATEVFINDTITFDTAGQADLSATVTEVADNYVRVDTGFTQRNVDRSKIKSVVRGDNRKTREDAAADGKRRTALKGEIEQAEQPTTPVEQSQPELKTTGKMTKAELIEELNKAGITTKGMSGKMVKNLKKGELIPLVKDLRAGVLKPDPSSTPVTEQEQPPDRTDIHGRRTQAIEAMRTVLNGDLSAPIPVIRRRLADAGTYVPAEETNNGKPVIEEAAGLINPVPIHKTIKRVPPALAIKVTATHRVKKTPRGALMGTYIDKGSKSGKVAVATDGRRAVIVPYEGPEKVGTIIGEWSAKEQRELHVPSKRRVIEGTFPNYKNVIPEISSKDSLIPVTPEMVELLRGAARAAQALPLDEKGEQGVVQVVIDVPGKREDPLICNATFVSEAIDALAKTGHPAVAIRISPLSAADNAGPILIETDIADAKAMVMPMRVQPGLKYDETGAVYIYLNRKVKRPSAVARTPATPAAQATPVTATATPIQKQEPAKEAEPAAEVAVATDTADGQTVTSPKGEAEAEAKKDGLTPQKQKKYLLAEIDAAIENAPKEPMPPSAEYTKYMLETADERGTLTQRAAELFNEHEKAQPGEARDKIAQERIDVSHQLKRLTDEARRLEGRVTIEVPDDGTFEILNTKEALRTFAKQARKFPVTKSKSGMEQLRSQHIPGKPRPAAALAKKRPEGRIPLERVLKSIPPTKDDARVALHDTHLNGDTGELVATDGRRMAVVLGVPGKTTVHTQDEYKEDEHGVSRPTGKKIPITYPNYTQVVPHYMKGETPPLSEFENTATINTEDFSHKLLQAQVPVRQDSRTPIFAPIYLMPDGQLEIATYDTELGSYESAEVRDGERIGELNVDLLLDGLAILRRLGNETATVGWNGPLSPFVFIGKREYYVLMPSQGMAAESGMMRTKADISEASQELPAETGKKGKGAEKYRRPESNISNEPTRTQTDTPAFGQWFKESKVVDDSEEPLRVYHGTQRPDRVGTRFQKNRATSGPMPFFTTDTKVASGYAGDKGDTSIGDEYPSYAHWFKVSTGRGAPVPIDRAWALLPSEQRARLADTLPRVVGVDVDGNEMDGYRLADPDEGMVGVSGRAHWDQTIKAHGGNVLAAAADIWLEGGTLFGEESDFMDVLRLAGMTGVKYDSPHASYPAIYPVYLSIQNPLDASNIPDAVMNDLRRLAKRQPQPQFADGVDAWDKSALSADTWMSKFEDDIAKGTTYAWTSIPDWVTRVLRKHGYDGIKDTGGKNGGDTHDVWIPFDPAQIKSATGNRGTFDPKSPDIRFRRSEQRQYYSTLERAVESLPDNTNMPADQFIRRLAGLANKGFPTKKQEIVESGFGDWLEVMKGTTGCGLRRLGRARHRKKI